MKEGDIVTLSRRGGFWLLESFVPNSDLVEVRRVGTLGGRKRREKGVIRIHISGVRKISDILEDIKNQENVRV